MDLSISSLQWDIVKKYISGVGLVCALWDHLLTLGDEIQYFWHRRVWTTTRSLFFCFRYMSLIGFVLWAYVDSGSWTPTKQVCRSWTVVLSTLIMMGISSCHAIIALRLYALWDGRNWARLLLRAIWGITCCLLLVFWILIVKFTQSNVGIASSLPLCTLGRKSVFNIYIWVTFLIFNIMTIIFTVSSALDRPYRKNRDIIERLRSDGFISFLLLTMTCTWNLIMQITADGDNVYTFFPLVWAIDVSVVSRLLLRLEAIKVKFSDRRLTYVSAVELYELNDDHHVSVRR
ncbi:hypothetical protein BDW22DRAFT_583201 [Trametopsis cervina]|nr:hypothetical protein BDW22DRAFT_583201 [Trametopsis cervina]